MNRLLNAKQKQPGAVKKSAAKQSRIKSIMWHLRWLVRTRVDISLQPSGLVRARTDINWIGKVIQVLIQKQIYMQIFFNCHLATFYSFKKPCKKAAKRQFKKICMYVYLLCIMILPILCIGRNLISILVLTNALGRKLISTLVLTSHLMYHTIFLILLCLATSLLTAPGCFCLVYRLFL